MSMLPPGHVGPGVKLRAVYSLSPRPPVVGWLLTKYRILATWENQPGVSIGDVNGNTIGIGAWTDEFYIDAVTTSPVDPYIAFPENLQILDGDTVRTLSRSELYVASGNEKLPTSGETFGETDWWELPLQPIRGVLDVVPRWLRWTLLLGVLLLFVYKFVPSNS